MSLESDLVTLLRSSAGTLSTATPAFFEGPPRKSGNGVPQNSVWVHVSGGAPVQSYMGETCAPLKPLSGRVVVRGGPRSYRATRDRAAAVIDVIHNAEISGWVRLSASVGAPVYWGPNDVEEEQFVVPFSGIVTGV